MLIFSRAFYATLLCLTLAIYHLNPAFADEYYVACTMEAKQCPDGSYVSRTGPHCEYSPCSSLKHSEKINSGNTKDETESSATPSPPPQTPSYLVER